MYTASELDAVMSLYDEPRVAQLDELDGIFEIPETTTDDKSDIELAAYMQSIKSMKIRKGDFIQTGDGIYRVVNNRKSRVRLEQMLALDDNWEWFRSEPTRITLFKDEIAWYVHPCRFHTLWSEAD